MRVGLAVTLGHELGVGLVLHPGPVMGCGDEAGSGSWSGPGAGIEAELWFQGSAPSSDPIASLPAWTLTCTTSLGTTSGRSWTLMMRTMSWAGSPRSWTRWVHGCGGAVLSSAATHRRC